MKTLTLQLPDTVDEKDVKMQLAASLYDKGIMSSGQAAQLSGISKRIHRDGWTIWSINIWREC